MLLRRTVDAPNPLLDFTIAGCVEKVARVDMKVK